MTLLRSLLIAGMTAIPILSQGPSAAQQRFEVASIKQNDSGSRASNCCGSRGRLVGTNITLEMLISTAYKVYDFQVAGGPGWVNTDRYDIEAKPPDDSPGNENQDILLGPMLQRLLEERFKLTVRRETREMPVFALTVAKGGSKLKSEKCTAPDPNTRQRSADVCGFSVMDNQLIRATQIDMPRFISMLTFWVRRPIMDKTGFNGTFDVDLRWNPNEAAAADATRPPADAGPSIFTALEEQLGLKLESTRGPVEVLVIDRVERPTQN